VPAGLSRAGFVDSSFYETNKKHAAFFATKPEWIKASTSQYVVHGTGKISA